MQNNNQIFKANGNKTSFSLRTLTRALVTIRNGLKLFKKTEIEVYNYPLSNPDDETIVFKNYENEPQNNFRIK